MKGFYKLALTILFVSNLTIPANSQGSKFFIESAIRFTGDAEMAFIGPSFSIGPGIRLGNHFTLSSTYTFFYDTYSDGDDKETFRAHTIDLLPIYHVGEINKTLRGFYLGMGLAWQNRKQTPKSLMIEKPSYLTAVFNLGYQFPIKLNEKERGLAIEWKATGPYRETSDTDQYLEQFTQFMIGLRFRY
jgi:hypothetical protein